MSRWRRIGIVVGAGAAGLAVVRRHRAGGHAAIHAEGGVLMADAASYDTLSGRLLGGFYRSIAEDVGGSAPAGARVLEIGCGPGHLASRLVRDHGLDVTGLDLDPAMIERSRARAERLAGGPRPQFVVGDAAALPFADGEFDLVVSTLSLHHWTDAEGASAEIARVLRPGGRVLVWDIRPGRVPMHQHAPDPASGLSHPSLRTVASSPWRWPWRVAWAQRLELVKADLSD